MIDLSLVLDDVSSQLHPTITDIESMGITWDMDMDFTGIPDAKDIQPPAYEAVASYTTSPSSFHSLMCRSGGFPILTPEEHSGASHLSRAGWTVISSSGRSVLSV